MATFCCLVKLLEKSEPDRISMIKINIAMVAAAVEEMAPFEHFRSSINSNPRQAGHLNF